MNVLRLRFNNGTLASQHYTDTASRQQALIYLRDLLRKWTNNGGLDGVTIEDDGDVVSPAHP